MITANRICFGSAVLMDLSAYTIKEQTATVDKNRDDFFDQIGALVGESEDSRFNMNRDDMANKKTMAQNED